MRSHKFALCRRAGTRKTLGMEDQIDAALITTAMEMPVAVIVAMAMGVFSMPVTALMSEPGSAVRAEVLRAQQRVLRQRFIRLFLTASCMSMITHPFLWYGALWWYDQPGWNPMLGIVVLETLVVIAEAAMLRIAVPLSWLRAGIISLAANGFSCVVGMWLTWS